VNAEVSISINCALLLGLFCQSRAPHGGGAVMCIAGKLRRTGKRLLTSLLENSLDKPTRGQSSQEVDDL